VKILAVDDHALIRAGLRTILQELADDVTVFEAANGADAESMLLEHNDIELVLLDVKLPDCDGLSLLCDLVARYPSLPIVVLSAESDAAAVTRAIDFGAAGFLPKSGLNLVLIPALRLVLAGGIYVPKEVLGYGGLRSRPVPAGGPESTSLPGFPGDEAGAAPDPLALTERQNDVLARLLQGKSNKQISRELDLAEATVKVHVRAILRALNVNSRTEAVVAFSRLGHKLDEPMLKQPEALSRSKHANLRFHPVDSFGHARTLSFVPLTIDEVGEASKSLPVVFAPGGKPRPIALLGVHGGNAFVDDAGAWAKGVYIPALIRAYPFALAKTAKGDDIAVAIDRSAPQFGSDGGEPLFDPDGQPGKVLAQAQRYLLEFHRAGERTDTLCQMLKEAGLLVGADVRRPDGKPALLPAVTVVDRNKLGALADETLLAWTKNGLLAAIHAHLNSLSNIRVFNGAQIPVPEQTQPQLH
jgi:DNA-binding NarL/FixJ family response regulator